MPRYFFHVFSEQVALDGEGLLLPDAEAAEREILRRARSLAATAVAAGALEATHRVDVVDETQTLVTSMSFSDAIDSTI